MRIMRVLSRDVAPHLAEVARVICDCDVDDQFDFGLELILAGLAVKLNRSPMVRAHAEDARRYA